MHCGAGGEAEGRGKGGMIMKRMTWIIVAAFFAVAWVAGPARADQVVQVPYGVKVGGWSTGLAITNLDDVAIVDLRLDIVTTAGAWHGPLVNYRENLGTLNPYAMLVGFVESLYGGTLPGTDGRFWCEIWHTGTEKFAVTVFVMNVTTGQGEGFGFYPFFSTSKSHSFPVWTAVFEMEPAGE
jgi:hypothetical protein